MAGTCCKYFTVSLVPVAALLLALLFACGILSLPILYTELEKRFEYGMVIDAGSSHTTIFIYNLRVPSAGEVAEIDFYNNISTESLDSSTPAEAAEVVEALLNHSNKSLNSIKVPMELHNTTRVYLGATAGMRLLRRSNTTASNETIDAVKEAMKKSGFKAKSANIISGREEAASGWLTANYLLKKSQKDLVGSLDLGGGSAEIAFTVSANATGPYHVVEKLMNKTEHLYARSYLCYGHNEARGRFLAYLVHSQNNKTVNVSNPCLSTNATVSHPPSKIYTYCASSVTAQQLFGVSFTPSASKSDISFVGTGNLTQCMQEIEQLFNFSSCYDPENCYNDTFKVPPVNGTLVGFSGFNYIAEALQIESRTFNYNHSLLQVIKDNCTDIFKNSSANNDLCFSGLFVGHMMEKGFGMNSASKDWTLIFKSKEADISFGWALGYFMNKTYEFPPKAPTHEVWPYTAVDMVIGMIILSILCAIFVVFFFLTFYACKKALKGHNGYQSIS